MTFFVYLSTLVICKYHNDSTKKKEKTVTLVTGLFFFFFFFFLFFIVSLSEPMEIAETYQTVVIILAKNDLT